jgi:AcrR family transcriptional regulator
VSVARAVRSLRSLEGPVRVAVERYRAAALPEELARITREQVVGRDAPEARRDVWALTDAIAAARDHPELREALTAAMRVNLDLLDDVLTAHRKAGVLAPDVHPRAMMLLSRALAHVRLLDDLDPRPVAHRDWVTVACRIHDGLVDPAPLPPVRSVTSARRTALLATIVVAAFDDTTDGDPRVVRLVARARDLLLSEGPDAVQVGRLRSELGLTAGWFHRRFGDRDGLLAAVRLDLLERAMQAEVRSLDGLIAAVRTPDELVTTTAAWLAIPDPGETVRRMQWQRAELLVAARSSPALGLEAGRTIAAVSDDLVRIIGAAQARGLVRPELAPRAVARVVQALVFGPLLAELDGTPIGAADWAATTRRALLPLTA